jgi:hypothetical protein
MSDTAAPFGLRPVKLLGDRPFTHGFRQIKIASGYTTSLYKGDVVKLVAGGTIEKDTGTDTATPVGVFMGCEYTDPNLGYLLHNNQWPASTVASDAYAYVADDPDALFLIQADATLGQNAIGMNCALVQGSGNSTFGTSGVSLDASEVATTNTLPVRIVDFWERDEIGTDYPLVLVKWTEGDHQYRSTTGNAAS